MGSRASLDISEKRKHSSLLCTRKQTLYCPARSPVTIPTMLHWLQKHTYYSYINIMSQIVKINA